MEHPKLRSIEAFPVDLGGCKVLCLRDPTQLTDDAVFVPREARMHAEGLFRVIAKPQDRRRICGFPPTDMLFSTMPATAATVLKYGQAVAPATQSMVSYASVVFH
jgi:hypothetical protein